MVSLLIERGDVLYSEVVTEPFVVLEPDSPVILFRVLGKRLPEDVNVDPCPF